MPERFNKDALKRLREAQEVRIQTSAAAGEAHSTVIWVVVDDRDRVLVRSYLGPSARWYREALANSKVTIEVDGRKLPVTAVVATDDERISAASTGLLAKYPDDPATPTMVSDAVLSTTLELVPRR